jgi:hypothetical protein
VQSPRHSVQEPDEAGLTHTSAKEGVGSEGSEGIIADFGIGGGGTAMDEGEVGVGLEDGGVEEDEPNVDSQRGLKGILA